jgi:hypothetical protein
LENLVGGPTKLLATVMALPLIDGIFPALVLAGTLDSPLQVVETGLLIFGGSATMAVILAEMDGSPREQVTSILVLAAFLLPVAALEASLAKTIESVIDMVVFKRFAALVILAVAAKTASSEVGELLPRPGAIIGLGLLASVSPSGLTVSVVLDPMLMLKAASAAGVGIAFALGVAITGPQLRGRVDIDRFRFGSAVALGVLGLSVLELGIVGSEHPVALGVLLVTAIFSYDPEGSIEAAAADDESDGGDGDSDAVETDDAEESVEDAEPVGDTGTSVVADGKGSSTSSGTAGAGGTTTNGVSATDGGSNGASPSSNGESPPTAAIDPVDSDGTSTDGEERSGGHQDGARAPWL